MVAKDIFCFATMSDGCKEANVMSCNTALAINYMMCFLHPSTNVKYKLWSVSLNAKTIIIKKIVYRMHYAIVSLKKNWY